MLDKITAIEPLNKVDIESYTINWNIGKRCNFYCSYCPKDLHDEKAKHQKFEDLVAAWHNILLALEKAHITNPLKIEFTGGEPTMNPCFLDFCKYLTNYKYQVRLIGVTTNGSKSYKYYEDLADYLNWMTFSSHFEFMNEKVFYTNILLLNRRFSKLHVSVNLMIEEWAKDKVEKMMEILVKEKIMYHPHVIRNYYNSTGIVNNCTQEFNYTQFCEEYGYV